MIQFSCSDYTFPLLERRKSLQVIRLLDFDFVDLGLFDRSPQLSPRSLMADGAAFTYALKQDLADAGLKASDLFLQIGEHPGENSANDPNESVRKTNREVFLRTLDLCGELQCAHLTGLPGVWHGKDADRDRRLAVEEASWRVESAQRAGVRYAIEPHIGSLCADVASTLDLLNAVPQLTLTLDYGHFIAAGESSDSVHALLPHASHMHARGGAVKRLQTSAAENTIHFPAIMERLRERDYSGFIALEYVWVDWEGCNRADNLSETILLRELLKRSLAA